MEEGDSGATTIWSSLDRLDSSSWLSDVSSVDLVVVAGDDTVLLRARDLSALSTGSSMEVFVG